MTDTMRTFRGRGIADICEQIVKWYSDHGADVKIHAIDGQPCDGMNWPINRSLCWLLSLRCGDERATVRTYALTGGAGDYRAAYGDGGSTLYAAAISQTGGKVGVTIHQSSWRRYDAG